MPFPTMRAICREMGFSPKMETASVSSAGLMPRRPFAIVRVMATIVSMATDSTRLKAGTSEEQEITENATEGREARVSSGLRQIARRHALSSAVPKL